MRGPSANLEKTHPTSVWAESEVPMSDTVKLSEAMIRGLMIRGLRDFAEPGGHGFGEHCYLSRGTAHALRDRGLVEFSVRDLGGGRKMRWGVATPDGRRVLSLIAGR